MASAGDTHGSGWSGPVSAGIGRSGCSWSGAGQTAEDIADRIERLYMCRRSMVLSEAADSGDHADALVLQTTLVELEAYGGRLPDLISGLKTDGGSLTESI